MSSLRLYSCFAVSACVAVFVLCCLSDPGEPPQGIVATQTNYSGSYFRIAVVGKHLSVEGV